MPDVTLPSAPEITGATHLHSGKVRDLYELTDGPHQGRLLMVASDRISIFDFVLATTIPDKGEILTRMSLWWFERLTDLVAHHVVSTDVPAAGGLTAARSLASRCRECGGAQDCVADGARRLRRTTTGWILWGARLMPTTGSRPSNGLRPRRGRWHYWPLTWS